MKKLIVWIVFMIAPALLWAQDIQMSASVDKNTVTLGNSLTLQVTVSGNAASLPNPTIPPMPGLTVTSSGRSQSISFVNGQVSSSITFSYIIMPQNIGKHTIQPIIMNVGGKVYETAPILIEVVQSPAPAPQSQQASPPVTQEKATQQESAQYAFVRAELDKKTAYVGEMVTYIFRFYRKIRLIGDAQYAPPEAVGFLKEDLPPQKNYYADMNGQRFLVSEIRVALFPTAPGELTIGPASLKITVPTTMRDPFFNDDFFGSIFGGQGETKVLTTNPLKVHVISCPLDNKPAQFQGAIGNFSITAGVDKKEVKIGEPVTVSITVAGDGNIKSITEPGWENINGFRKYDTVSSLNSKVENYRIQGSKVFQTIMVPEISGERTIPSLSYAFFNLNTKQYRVVTTQPLTIKVAAGEGTNVQSVAQPQGTGIRMIEKDIRFIKTQNMKRTAAAVPFMLTSGYWLVMLSGIISIAVSWFFETYRMRLTHDISWARSRTALKNAKKHVRQAQHFFKKNDDKNFYSKITDAITGIIADRMNISQAGLTVKEIHDQLAQKNVDEAVREDIQKIIEQCDLGRFTASVLSGDEKKKLLQETKEIIVLLAKYLR